MVTQQERMFVVDNGTSTMFNYIAQYGHEVDLDSNDTNGTDPCGEYKQTDFLEIKFWAFAVLGSVLCFCGIISDSLLLYVLMRPTLKRTYLIYYSALTFLDICILATIILVWIVPIVNDYFSLPRLYIFWLSCIPYLYPLSRLLTLASTYLIVACTIERYLEVVQLRYHVAIVKMNQSRRYIVMASVFAFCLLFRLPSVWEVHVLHRPNCSDWLEYALDQTELARNEEYKRISFWMSNIVVVFTPFLLLLVLNALITVTWTNVDCQSQSSKSARKMMIAIMTSYLICNMFNLVITVFEVVDKPYLLENETFYTLSADVVFVLTAINSSFRLPIYYTCNFKIQTETKKICIASFVRMSSKPNHQMIVSNGEGVALMVSARENGDNGCQPHSTV